MRAPRSAIALALTCCLSVPVLAQTAPPGSLTPDQIAAYNACVENTVQNLDSNSDTLCRTPDMYIDSGGNTNSQRYTLTVTIDPKFLPNYYYVPGSSVVARNDGQCVHDVTPVIDSPSSFRCVLYTKGCGLTKAGGHVHGACSVRIRYGPQAGDIAKAKEYCFGQIFGLTVKKPVSSSINCVIQ